MSLTQRTMGMALVLTGLLVHGPVACCQPGLCVDPSLDPGPVTATDGGRAIQPTLSDIQAKIFTPSCATSGCHNATFAARSGELDLTDGVSFAQLVGANSALVAGEKRVVAGSPQTSFLLVKLVRMWQSNPPQSVGDPMPAGAQLSADELQAIQDWIADGAQNN